MFARGTRVICPFKVRLVNVKVVVRIHRRAIELAIGGCPEIGSHLICRTGYDTLESRTDISPIGIGCCVGIISTQAIESVSRRTRHQEIWSRLPILRFVPHIHEIPFCLFRRAKVCHLSFVDEAYFIKQVEKLLSSLIDRDDGRDLGGIGRDPKCSDELERRGRIQSTCRTR